MALPLIHSILPNRSTQYDKKASQAFGAMFQEIQSRTNDLRLDAGELFHTNFEY